MATKFIVDGVIQGQIKWTPPTTRTDGSGYGATDHQGYTLGVQNENGVIQDFVSVPAIYGIEEWPINDLNLPGEGNYVIALKTVDNDNIASAWSNTVDLEVVAKSRPNPPTGLVVL